ncbi:MAG: FGGY family carbohydrate kinase [Eubacteriales bacterium]|nr:FGGY family carbohydrate kinase [Eubacteriales bacterium]
MFLLGLDLGTTSVKAAVFDEHGKRYYVRSIEYSLDTDPSTGYIELAPEKYTAICRELIDEAGASFPLTALSIDSQGETMILTDADDRPLCPAINWMDCRATAEAAAIEAHFGRRRVYEVTGQPEITGGWPASKLLWFRNNRPELFDRIRHVYLLEDWIIRDLCGAFVSERTLQSSSVYFDIRCCRWWDEMLEFIGVSSDVLPQIVPCGTCVGNYGSIKVVAGALDQIAGSIGAGVSRPGQVSEMTGTIMAVCAPCTSIPDYTPDSIIPCHLHALDGMYCRLLWSSAAGVALKWFRDVLMPGRSFRELDELAGAVAPGCDGLTFLPHLCGSSMPVYNPDAKGCFYGLTLAHGGGHFVRAILESVAFMLKSDLDYIGLTPGQGREIRITGGGAAGTLWPQIKADVTGFCLGVPTESETACLGAAILAGVGAGAYASLDDAVKSAVGVGRRITPSGADYTSAYDAYRSLDAKLNVRKQ